MLYLAADVNYKPEDVHARSHNEKRSVLGTCRKTRKPKIKFNLPGYKGLKHPTSKPTLLVNWQIPPMLSHNWQSGSFHVNVIKSPSESEEASGSLLGYKNVALSIHPDMLET
ncbi:hypothetical protein SCA6_005433 [Theobroma cacao]